MPRLPAKKTSEPTPELPTVALALLLCVIFGGGFFGLLAVVIPGAGMLGLALIVLGLLFVAQYFIWGRWLYGIAVRKEAEADARRVDARQTSELNVPEA